MGNRDRLSPRWTFLVLAPGPLFGAWRMTKVELVGKAAHREPDAGAAAPADDP